MALDLAMISSFLFFFFLCVPALEERTGGLLVAGTEHMTLRVLFLFNDFWALLMTNGHLLMLRPWFEKQPMTGHIQKFFIKFTIQGVEVTHL